MDLSTRTGRREQGQRIQQAVERAGISIEELAGRIGCSRALIYQYLSGSTLAQPDRLQQIAAHCGVPLTYFYSEVPNEGLRDAAQAADSSILTNATPVPDAEATSTPAPDVSPTSAPTLTPQDVTTRLNEGLRSLQELADAQESPPDYRAVASTCERILSLASQIGDTATQARAQLDLGIALNKIGDFPRAVEALNRAVALSAETSNAPRELSARQSLGKALLMMGRTEEAREQFQRITDSDDFDARWRGLLSLGSIHEQKGEYAQAMQRFEEAAILLEEGQANRAADAQDIAVGLLYVNTNRRNVYLAGGDLAEARRLAEKCLSDAEALGNADQNLAARLDLGWCDLYAGQWAQAQSGLTTMLQLARFVGDLRRETMARIALGILQAAAGDFDAAIDNGKDALAFALSRGDRLGELYAHLALTDAYSGASGRRGEARYHATQALNVTTSTNYARSEVECRLRFARLFALSGDTGGLREAASRALVLARNLGARHLESLARVWESESLLRTAQTAVTTSQESRQNTASDTAHNTPDERLLSQAQTEAQTGLTLADETQFVETRWRANDVLAQIALVAPNPDEKRAEQHLRTAIATLDALRASLLAADLSDTLLENEDCVAVYARLARLLLRQGRAAELNAFLEQAGWPPLDDLIAVENASASSQP